MKWILVLIETAFAYILAVLELQFEAVSYLPTGHPAKKKLVHQVQQIASGALNFIEEVEAALIRKVETRSEEVLASSAQFRETIREASEHIPDLPVLQQLKQVAIASHRDLVTDLQREENEIESELRDRLKAIKQKICKILDRIDCI